MIRAIIIFILLYIPIELFAQKQINIVVNDSWYKWHTENIKKLRLTKFEVSKDKFDWRISYYGQVTSYFLEIRQNTDFGFNGSLTIYTDEHVDVSKEFPTGRIFSVATDIDSSKSLEIYKLLRLSKINDLPTDMQIKGWSEGMDGITYVIENADAQQYSLKSYWTPSAQENLLEANKLQDVVNEIERIVSYKDRLAEFASKIPFESYNTGGPATAVRVLTRKQRRDYKMDRYKYRKANNISNKKPNDT